VELKTISPLALHALMAKGQAVQLIDVRTPVEFEEIHAAPARNVPMDRLDAEQFRSARGERLFLICKSGTRGQQACEKLVACGIEDVANVSGGTDEWNKAGLPVVRGRKTMSLERQVRIAAGALTLIGAILSLTVHPYCAGISAFVGAGLVFAGLNDTCGMALILARMPWNQRG
jgi:rhodanese-related sulfurtransferase